MDLDVLVINRTKDTDRLAAFSTRAAERKISARRVAALDAHRPGFPFAAYDQLLRDHFWGQPEVKPGAIGCFLSHRKAWAQFLAGAKNCALIVEDDADPILDAATLESHAAAARDYDLVFANSRMAAWAAITSGTAPMQSLPDVLSLLARRGGPAACPNLTAAPGADAYLVSRAGAERLLLLTGQLGIVCGVDWALIWAGLPASTINDDLTSAFPELDCIFANAPAATPVVRAAVMRSPVAELRKGIPSVLRHRSQIPIQSLRKRTSVLCHSEYVSTISNGNSELFFAGRSGNDPVMASHRAGHLWDEPGLRCLLRHFPEGGTFVDIGAHIGNHAVVIGRMGLAGRLILVEPNDEVRRVLQTNLGINGLSQISETVPDGTAFGREAGQGWLVRNRRKSSETMVRSAQPENDDGATEEIRIIQGDTALAGHRVDAIKIDTSGSEFEVLRGLERTLHQQRPIVLMDHSADQQDRVNKISQRFGYCVDETLPTSRANRMVSLLLPKQRTDVGQ